MIRNLATIIFLFSFIFPAAALEAVWVKLGNGGYTVLLSHAAASGSVDPPDFEIGDCSTQRRLSSRGSQEARNIGARIATRGVRVDTVRSSQWCIALDTAALVFDRAEVEEFPALNPLSDYPDEQLAEVIAEIRAFRGAGNQMLVTHPENIEELAGRKPRRNEGVLLEADPDGDGVRVAGRIIFN